MPVLDEERQREAVAPRLIDTPAGAGLDKLLDAGPAARRTRNNREVGRGETGGLSSCSESRKRSVWIQWLIRLLRYAPLV